MLMMGRKFCMVTQDNTISAFLFIPPPPLLSQGGHCISKISEYKWGGGGLHSTIYPNIF